MPKKIKPVRPKSTWAKGRVLGPKSGKVRKIGIVAKVRCPVCRGDGRKEGKDCPACDGKGEISEN